MCELIGIIPMFESVYHNSEMLANQISNELAFKRVGLYISCRVPTSSGNHGNLENHEKSSVHGKLMEFEIN